VSIHIVPKPHRHQNVTPICLRQFDGLAQLLKVTSAQFQCCEANPLQLKLIALLTEREIIAALMHEKFDDLFPRTGLK